MLGAGESLCRKEENSRFRVRDNKRSSSEHLLMAVSYEGVETGP